MSLRLSRQSKVKLLVVLGAVLFGLVGAELILRTIGYSHPIYHRPDIERGWFPWEGLDATFSTGVNASLRFNADGIRGPEVAHQAPSGVFRIAVLGDSMTEAREVAYDATFVAGIEAELASCQLLEGRRPETLNFGVSGYGTHQQLIDYRLRVGSFAPDLVLLVVFPGNDVSNNSAILDGNRNRPYISLRNGTLKPSGPANPSAIFERSLRARIYNAIRVLQLIEQVRRIVKYGILGPRAVYTAGGGAPVKEDWVMAPPRDESWREAWEITLALLTGLKHEVEAGGSTFAVAVASVPIQVSPDQSERARFKASLGIEDLHYPNRRLRAWAVDARATLLDPLRVLQAEVAKDNAYLHGFEQNGTLGYGHYNRSGHAAFARALGQALCNQPELFPKQSTK